MHCSDHHYAASDDVSEPQLQFCDQQIDRPAESSGSCVPDQGDRGGQIEIGYIQYPEVVPMWAVFELTLRDEAETATLRQQRQLEILPENFRSDMERELKPLERLDQSRTASAACRIEEPAFVREIPEAPGISITSRRFSGCRDDNHALEAERDL